MRAFRFLSVEDRVRVLVLHEEGYSSTKIAQKVGCNQSTVVRILQKHKELGVTQDRYRCGRTRKSTNREDRVLIRTSLANRKLTSSELLREWQDKCGVKVAPSTVRKRCLEAGFARMQGPQEAINYSSTKMQAKTMGIKVFQMEQEEVGESAIQ